MVAGTAAQPAAAIGWAQLYAELRPTLARALAAATGSYEGVEDAIQEAFAVALGKDPATLRSPEAWLYAVALNRIRRQRRRAAILSRLRLRPASASHDLDQALQRVDLVRDLQALAARDRELLVAKYYLGMSQEQLADWLKTPRGTIAARIARAAARFRELESK